MATQRQNQREFELDIKRISEKLDVDAVTVARKLTFDVFRGIVLKTPVDTGRARASWNIGVGRPDDTVSGGTGGSKGDSVSQGIAQSKGSKGVSKVRNLRQQIFITNALPYIKALEEGHSAAQAPEGMVRVTLEETKARINKIVG